MFDRGNDPKLNGPRKHRKHRQDRARRNEYVNTPRVRSCRAEGNPPGETLSQQCLSLGSQKKHQLRDHGKRWPPEETSCYLPLNFQTVNGSSGNPLPLRAHDLGNVGVGLSRRTVVTIQPRFRGHEHARTATAPEARHQVGARTKAGLGTSGTLFDLSRGHVRRHQPDHPTPHSRNEDAMMWPSTQPQSSLKPRPRGQQLRALGTPELARHHVPDLLRGHA